MNTEEKKKGLLARLIGRKRPKKSPCCGDFVVEEVPEGESAEKAPNAPPQPKKKACCG